MAVSVAAWARTLPNLYHSETLILVVPQRVPESYVRSTVTTRIEDRLQSITQQILSRTRLERIIQDFNLYADERRTAIMEDIVERMRKEIEVQVVKGDAFRVGFTSDEARTAMRVTERLASLFIEENLRDREVLAEGTNQFLEAQLEDARRRLIENEKRLEDYRRQHSGELPTQLEANMQGQHNIEMQLQALLESVNRDRDRRLALERLLADANTPDPVAPPPRPGTMSADGVADRRHRRRSAAGRAGRAAGAATARDAGTSGHAADDPGGRRAPEKGGCRSAGAPGVGRSGAVDAGRDHQAQSPR